MGQQLENTKQLASPASWRWDSPMIYLFGGIGLMLLLILVALLMLACSQRWFIRSEAAHGGDVITGGGGGNGYVDQKVSDLHVCSGGDEVDVSPKIAVIMAGDDIPTYLAAPEMKSMVFLSRVMYSS